MRVLKSSSGQQQGDTLGSFLFCLGIHPILEAAHAKWPALLIRAICDDIHVAGPDADVAEAFHFLLTELGSNFRPAPPAAGGASRCLCD